jgi:2-keto-4-pentenoate hydratase
MISDVAALAAADHLAAAYRDGTVIEALPPSLRPMTRADGYRVQAHVMAETAKPLYGWKIAGTNAAGRAHIGIASPLAGRLLAERVMPAESTIALGANRMRVAEPEFAFRMARDLAPRDQPYTVDEVMAAVADLYPAIEIPDSRFTDFATAGEPQLIADNACAHQFVLGAAAADRWRSLDLRAHPVQCRSSSGRVHDGNGRNVLDDPRLALTWLVNELSGLCITLRAGEVVTTGTAAVPVPITSGDHITADFGQLGTVEIRFA